MSFNISLQGKTALVTGGATGIGAEICRQMANAGANVVINYYHCDADREAARELDGEIRRKGVSSLCIEADVSNEAEVSLMLEKTTEAFGGVDIVVNNAGVLINKSFDELSYTDWRMVNGVILDGAFLVSKHSLPLMKPGGNFIMITTNCTINGGGGSAAYPAAKSGVEGLAKQIVVDYASKGIRANIIQPAVIDTKMFRIRFPSDEEVRRYGERMPVGRVGTPEDIAYAAVFLASDMASYICGVTLQVDGGRTFYSKMK